MASSTNIVHHYYTAGFIVLSYIVSVVGCWTTLELLSRKTSKRGLYNWYLLGGAAMAMGAVGIWSMHFIGNRAITMEDGQPDLQIGYNPFYTAGSFFLPICAVAAALYIFEISQEMTVPWTIAGGSLCGVAICGMHYMGQGGISNYEPIYDWKYVVGSAVIAVVAATLSLGVFFWLKSKWTNTWWKRMITALFLAAAVSGMHWVATVGTSYRLKSSANMVANGMSRETTIVVVLCLAVGCCIVLIACAAIGQKTRQRYADRAQQVVLACATWDEDGRILVTPEGLLPCRKITNQYMERSFKDVFSIDHPVFCWIFRVTRNWQSVASLIPSMRTHLRSGSFARYVSPVTASIVKDTMDSFEDYAQIFKELFCIAAQDLASSLQEPLDKLGVLYDEIVSTGTVKRRTHGKAVDYSWPALSTFDLEYNECAATLGRGQLLFVVRKVNSTESANLQASGFRFAPVRQVLEHLARSMEITVEELRPRLDKMRSYPTEQPSLSPGVYLSLFALRPLYQRGFDVLVNKEIKNLLPTVNLPYSSLERWQIDYLKRWNNWPAGRCLHWLGADVQAMLETSTDREKIFFAEVFNQIHVLSEQINAEFFKSARLISKVMRTPCYDPTTGNSGQAEIIAFRYIVDVHQTFQLDKYEFVPSRFFLCQQHVYPHSPDHALFTRKVVQEFADILERSERSTDRASLCGKSRRIRDIFKRKALSLQLSSEGSQQGLHMTPSTSRGSSEKETVEEMLSGHWGGIHVSSEVTVDVTEARSGSTSPGYEMSTLGTFNVITVDTLERPTYVDELWDITTQERQRT